MTTCLDIIRRALLAAEGEREVPGGADGQLALMRLQDVILSLPRLMNGPWRDVRAQGTAVAATDGMRVHADAAAVVTLPLPLSDGEGAPPADLSRVQVIGPNAAAGVWVYAASTGAWRRADGLSLSSPSPFGPEDDAGLSSLLALSVAADGGGTVSPETMARVARAAAALSRFAARFHRAQDETTDPALLRLSDMGWAGW